MTSASEPVVPVVVKCVQGQSSEPFSILGMLHIHCIHLSILAITRTDRYCVPFDVLVLAGASCPIYYIRSF